MSSHTRVIASVRRSLLDDLNAAADDSHVFFTPPSKTDDEQFETNIVKKDHQQFEMNCSRIIGKVRKRSFEDNQLNCSTSIRKLSFEDHQLNSSKKVRKISVEDHQLNCSKKVRKISFEDHQAAMKLLNSIERIEKIVMERIKRLSNAPAAKKAEWDRKIRNLMSMRMKHYYAWSAFMRGDLLLVTQAWISQEHVKTKSKAQCIVHFLSFPMDDSSMKNVEVPHIPISVKLSNNDECDRSHSNLHGHHAGLTLQDTNAESRVPFANYANPIMALVAFLASAVGPRVAAAYAHTTLIELTLDDQVATSDYNITDSSQQEDSTPLSDAKLRAASKAGLSAAATKSKLFADHEEREIQRLSTNIINHQEIKHKISSDAEYIVGEL